jgi:MFS family permease
MSHTKYTRRIDTARKAVAMSFAVCGLGLVVIANIASSTPLSARPALGWLAVMMGLGMAASLIVAFALFVEYLVRVRIESRRSRQAWYQFSIVEVMVAMAIIGLILGVFRVLGWITIGLLLLAVLLVACVLESIRTK